MFAQAAREQFSKVLRLVQLGQFKTARLELREGIASNLRKDLRDAQEQYPAVSLEVRPHFCVHPLSCNPSQSLVQHNTASEPGAVLLHSPFELKDCCADDNSNH